MAGSRPNLYAVHAAYRLVDLGKDMMGYLIALAFIVRFYLYAEDSDVPNVSFEERTANDCNKLNTTSGEKIQCIKATHLGILAKVMKLEPDYNGRKVSKDGQAFGAITTGSFGITDLDVSSLSKEQKSCVIDILENAITKELDLPEGSTVTVTSIGENGVAEYEIVMYYETSAEADATLVANYVNTVLSQASTWKTITESVTKSSQESSDSSIQNAITPSTRVTSHTNGGSQKKKVWSIDQMNRFLAKRLRMNLSNFGVKTVHRVREDETEPGYNAEHRETDVYYFAQEKQKDLFVSGNLDAVEDIKNVTGSDKSINNKRKAD